MNAREGWTVSVPRGYFRTYVNISPPNSQAKWSMFRVLNSIDLDFEKTTTRRDPLQRIRHLNHE